MLGILGSLIAALLFESSKSWRNVYREFPKPASLFLSPTAEKLTLRRIRLTASAFMVTMTALVFLSHSPKLAPDDIVTQKMPTRGTSALVSPRTPSDIRFRPCVVDNSPCSSTKSHKKAILLSAEDF
jgi:hypothetical protein